jgi:hypothetical protein
MKCDGSKGDILAQKCKRYDTLCINANADSTVSKNYLLFHLLTYQTGNISNIFTSVCEAAGPTGLDVNRRQILNTRESQG